jgi:hypothetical protein
MTRYHLSMNGLLVSDPNGNYVTYEDAEAAVAEAVAKEREEIKTALRCLPTFYPEAYTLVEFRGKPAGKGEGEIAHLSFESSRHEQSRKINELVDAWNNLRRDTRRGSFMGWFGSPMASTDVESNVTNKWSAFWKQTRRKK